MGCDYSIWIETVIEYTTATGSAETYVERGEYDRRYTYSEEYSHLDPDFDVIPKIDRIQEEIDEYGERHMYNKSNGIWICQPSGRKRVEAICEEHKIPMSTVTCVFKRKGANSISTLPNGRMP